MTPSVSSDAERDLTDAALFYLREGNEGLGSALIDEFQYALDLLCANPHLGSPWRGSTRRFPLRRFPYSIVYRIGPGELRVIALAHQRRRPGYWRTRK